MRRSEWKRTDSSPIPRSAFPVPRFVILLILFSSVLVWAQDDVKDAGPYLSATLDRDTAKVGEMVVLTLRYRLPEGSLVPEELQITGLEGLTIVEQGKGPGEIRVKLLVDRLNSWNSGALGLVYFDKAGKIHTLEADPLSLAVLSNLQEEDAKAQLRPIQGIISTTATWWKYSLWVAGLLVVALAVSVFLWWRKRRRTRHDSLKAKDPPHILALREMGNLEAQRLFEKGEVKEFYFLFTEILRRYLESLRSFPAAVFTTEEIARHIDNDRDRILLPLLREADLVKFADRIPTPAAKQDDLKTALAYIRETSPDVEQNGAIEASREVPQ